MVNGNSSYFNSLNPFITSTPGYYSEIFNGNVSGPIDKKASVLVGDKPSDLEAALRAGIKSVLFTGGDLAQFLSNEALLPN